jgi:hypothetical protein
MASGSFTMRVTLGNDAMQTSEHVAAALRQVAALIGRGRDCGKVMDANGNSCGVWDLDLPEEEGDSDNEVQS